MTTYTQRDPLTDAELDRLGGFLEGCKGGKAMNLEELDGFLAALLGHTRNAPAIILSTTYFQVLSGNPVTC